MGEEGEASLIYGLELQVMAFSFVGKSHSKAVVQNKWSCLLFPPEPKYGEIFNVTNSTKNV